MLVLMLSVLSVFHRKKEPNLFVVLESSYSLTYIQIVKIINQEKTKKDLN